MTAIAVVLMGAVALLIIVSDSTVNEDSIDTVTIASTLGPLVFLQVAFATVLGPNSSRMPVAMADVSWLYTLPIGWKPLLLSVAAQRFVKFIALYLAVMSVFVVFSSIEGRPPSFSPLSLAAPSLLIASLALLYTTSGTRGSRAASRLCVGVSIITFGALIVQGVLHWRSGEALASSTAGSLSEAFGRILVGQASPLGWLCIAWSIALGIALLLLSDGEPARDSAVRDAELWGEMTFSSVLNSRQSTESTSIRSMKAGAWLTGSSALMWAEIAVLRRQRWNLLGYAVSAVAALILLSISDLFLGLVLAFPALQLLTTSWNSGVVAHMRLGSFNEPPGPLALRVLWSEIVSTAQALVVLGIVIAVAVPIVSADVVSVQSLWAPIQLMGMVLCTRVVTPTLLVYRKAVVPGALFAVGQVAALGIAIVISLLWFQVALTLWSTPSFATDIVGWLLVALALILWLAFQDRRTSGRRVNSSHMAEAER